jgi:peptidyl-prolyl cis-trans isomerase SurA
MRAALSVGIGTTLALFVLARAAAAEKVPGWVEVDRVVAVVNGNVILDSEVARRVAPMAPGPGKPPPAEARKQMLDTMIDELLLTQEASRVRIEVSDQDVTGAIQEIKKQNGLDDAGFEKALAAQGYTPELYREDVRQQILRLRAINVVIRPRVVVRDEELEAAYKEARKANPKLGTFEAEKPRLQQVLFEQRMAAETQKWLLERRLASFIAVKKS